MFKKKKIARPVNARDSTEGLAHTWTLQETQWARQPTPWNVILAKHEAFCDYFTQAKDIPSHSLKKEFFKRLSSFLGQLLLSKGLLDTSHWPSQSLSLLTCELKTTGSTSQRNYGIEGGDTVIVPSMRVLSWSPSHSTGWISMDHHTR